MITYLSMSYGPMVQWSNPTTMYQSVSAVPVSTPSGYELHIFCIKAEIEIQILSDVLSLTCATAGQSRCTFPSSILSFSKPCHSHVIPPTGPSTDISCSSCISCIQGTELVSGITATPWSSAHRNSTCGPSAPSKIRCTLRTLSHPSCSVVWIRVPP